MPTNFTVSSQPALRCVAGETYPLSAAEPAVGFFTRLRVAERLVIHSGPQQALRLAAAEWAGSSTQLGRATGFGRETLKKVGRDIPNAPFRTFAPSEAAG